MGDTGKIVFGIAICLVILQICVTFIEAKENEFVAGSFILTQKSLNEAPYRYSGVLRQVLDKVETKDPPSQFDEEECSAKYRILPSGKILSHEYLTMF